MANPLIDDYRRMQRIPIDAPPMIAGAMPSGPIVLPSSASPMVRQQDPAIQATQTRLIGDQGEYQRKLDTGSGISQIKNPLLRGLATAGDIAERIVLPGAERVTPGTEGNHERLLAMGAGRIGQDLSNAQSQAQTTLLDAQPQLKEQALENQLLKTQTQGQHYQDMAELGHERNRTNLRNHGFAMDEADPTGNSLRPLRYDEMSEQQQAVLDINHVNEELRKAQKEYQDARTKNLPVQAALAQQRIDGATQARGVAMQKLGLQKEAQDFAQDKFYNPQPTAIERGKGDMAQSAVERIAEMRDVIKKHPDWFGPGAGRGQAVKVAIGNQDPDMQKYMSAAQILSDHSAAMFGGRGKYIMQQLHGLTEPHFNPAALNAALDEAERSSVGFVRAGTPHGKGGSSSYGGGKTQRFTVDGKAYDIPADQVSDFKKEFPNAK